MSMLIEVWGDYACFSRPEMKTERVSYDIMTPSAARGLVEAIYWHPGEVPYRPHLPAQAGAVCQHPAQ